jgi:hypothetical protein
MHRNNNPPPVNDTSMGRPPTVTEKELVSALQVALDWPVVAAVETPTVAAETDVPAQTVRNRLQACRDDGDSPIEGLRPGGQGGWVWWLTDETLYDD